MYNALLLSLQTTYFSSSERSERPVSFQNQLLKLKKKRRENSTQKWNLVFFLTTGMMKINFHISVQP